MAEYTINDIREKIKNIIDPIAGKTLEDTKGIKHIGIDNDKNLVILIIVLMKCGGEEEKLVKRELARIIKLDMGFTGIKITFEEKRIIESIVKSNVKFILIESGKGGVGKSTVSANIAYALRRMGKKVGIIDADIYGSSIPQILEMKHAYPKADENGKIVPLEAYGMEVISTEFFAEEGKPVIWRGAMISNVVKQFYTDVLWEELDYLIIDMPPGTGDVALTVMQSIPINGVIMVTVPQDMVSMIVAKAVHMVKKLNIDVIGVVENMSYIKCPDCGKKIEIFKGEHNRKFLDDMNLNLFGQLPMNTGLGNVSLGIYNDGDEEVEGLFNPIVINMIRSLEDKEKETSKSF